VASRADSVRKGEVLAELLTVHLLGSEAEVLRHYRGKGLLPMGLEELDLGQGMASLLSRVALLGAHLDSFVVRAGERLLFVVWTVVPAVQGAMRGLGFYGFDSAAAYRQVLPRALNS